MRQGVLESQGEYILFMDADNSTKISELGHFLEAIRTCDIVIGSRALSGSQITVAQHPLKRMAGRAGNVLVRLLLGIALKDTQCGFKLFRKKAKVLFEMQVVEGWGFDFEILFLAHKGGFLIQERPVMWVNNFDSKVTSVDYVRSLGDLLRVRARYALRLYTKGAKIPV